ncbi:uncharacterized protein LOC142784049 [Rhipicephalus microplus]|uniref:uncharacterized protein LOC142784049 n=1 Tax=Rhipicephalus microplus TaxID=6941 RepID=UPI003F6A8254
MRWSYNPLIFFTQLLGLFGRANASHPGSFLGGLSAHDHHSRQHVSCLPLPTSLDGLSHGSSTSLLTAEDVSLQAAPSCIWTTYKLPPFLKLSGHGGTGSMRWSYNPLIFFTQIRDSIDFWMYFFATSFLGRLLRSSS